MGVTSQLEPLLKALTQEIEDLQESSVQRDIAKGREPSYSEADAAEDIRRWHGIAKACYEAVERNIESAARSIPNWGGCNVTLVPTISREGPVSWYGDEPKLAASPLAYVHKGSAWRGSPSFTIFVSDEGEILGIDDVLDAGDSDFFKDHEVEADYFQLTEELRHPGKARSQGNKIVTLYTARPAKDRHIYERAQKLPANVFLTTDPDEAYGYSRDLPGARDVYMVRIKRMYLVETLDAGRVKNYQTFSGQGNTVPIEDISLIAEGERTARVVRRYLSAARNQAKEVAYETTAGELAQIMFGHDATRLAVGNYPGTEIPVRKVPNHAPVTFYLGPNYGFVEDSNGGWIAEHFGPSIGLREARRCADALSRKR